MAVKLGLGNENEKNEKKYAKNRFASFLHSGINL